MSALLALSTVLAAISAVSTQNLGTVTTLPRILPSRLNLQFIIITESCDTISKLL